MADVLTARRSPYVGPRAFLTGEALYGRDREAEKLLNLLIAERIVLLYAPSGAGKTSLLQAGLIPRLRDEEFETLPVVRVSLEPPFSPDADRARGTANRYLVSTLLSLEESRRPEDRLPLAQLVGLDLAGYLAPQPSPVDEAPVERVLIFDQFEEVLTVDPTDHDAKAAFFGALGEALRDRQIWALFAMREDYVAGLDPYLRPVPTRLRTTFRLDLLGEEAARLAIQRPARDAGVDFTDPAAQQLVDDLRRVSVQRPDGSSEEQQGSYVEPVQLQVVCARLWNQLRPEVRQIVPTDIESVGNVDEALAGYYADRVAAIATRSGASERAIREWVGERLIAAQGIRGQVLQGVDTSDGLANQAIQALVDAHLVRSERRRGFTWFELAHDRLIGPIQNDNTIWFQQNLSELQRQAALWDKHDRPAGLLARGPELKAMELWAGAHAVELTEAERAFLDAGREAAAVARTQRRTNLLVRVLLGVMMIVSVIAFYFFGQARAESTRAAAEASIAQDQRATAVSAEASAVAERSRADAKARVALSRQLAAQALTQVGNHLDTALLLSLEAYDVDPTLEARSSLIAGLASSPRLIAILRGDGDQVTSVSFSPDGNSLASASIEGTILMWSVSTHQRVAPTVRVTDGAVEALAFSPDGKTLAAAASDKTIRLLDVAALQAPGAPLMGHTDAVYSVAFSPDGQVLASAGADDTIRMWDATTRQALGPPLRGHTDRVEGVAFSPDGSVLASVSDDRTVRLWNVRTHQPIGEPLTGHSGAIEGLAFSPDGKVLATASDDTTVRLWDLPAHQPLGSLAGHSQGVHSVAFSPDGRTLASAGADGTIILWNVTAHQPIGLPLVGHASTIWSVAFSPDGSILASAGEDNTVRLWDLAFRQSLDTPLANSLGGLTTESFSPNGKVLASAGADNKIRLWDAANLRLLASPLIGHTDTIWNVAFSPDGQVLASAGGHDDKSIRLWDVATRQALGTPLMGHTDAVISVAFSPDGKILASAGGHDDKSIRLWDVATRQALGAPLIGHTDAVWSVAFSPDGKILASAGADNTIRLWDVATRQALDRPLNGHSSTVTSLAFSSDGQVLASASYDKSIRLWDVATRQALGAPLIGHTDAVWSVAFSPDGKILASAGGDNTIRLWDVATRQALGTPFRGHTDAVHSVTFTPDGKTLASASYDGTIMLWQVDLARWMIRACRVANRNLSPDEWHDYLSGEQYHRTCPSLP